MSFILALNEAVKGKQLSDPCTVRSGAGRAQGRCRAGLPMPPGPRAVGRQHAHHPARRAKHNARVQVSEAVQKLVGALDTLWRWVDETPPTAHTLRYGNPAYRTWFAQMAEAAPQVGGQAAP